MVFVAILLLTLGAYTFCETMLLERETVVLYARGGQARCTADSAIEFVAALLRDPQVRRSALVNRPDLFQAVLVTDGASPRQRSRFSIVSAEAPSDGAQAVRFGLSDESARLNVNDLAAMDPAVARRMLMALPAMTEATADTLLDWIDADREPRPYGAEVPNNTWSGGPYQPKNAPLASIDELLGVPGFTPELLYGADTNRNGLLDRAECDGGRSRTIAHADGPDGLGWSAWLTVHGTESNLRLDGRPRIHLNADDLTPLYDELAAEFDEQVARFVIACRLNGLAAGPDESDEIDDSSDEQSGSSDESTVADFDSSFDFASGRERLAQFREGIERDRRAEPRGGMDLSAGGDFELRSVFDFVGTEAKAVVDGEFVQLESPWPADASFLLERLPDVEARVSTRSSHRLPGRVNVNQAAREVLQGLPGLTADLAEQIALRARVRRADPAGHGDPPPTIGWLYTDGVLPLSRLRELAPYVTAGGDAIRFQVVSDFESGGPFCRLEAVVDASPPVPRIVFRRDLTHLGRGDSSTGSRL